MAIEIDVTDDRWFAADLAGHADTAITATLKHFKLAANAFEISILGCDDARIAELNASFRGKDAPTNVLSWPSVDRAATRPGDAPTAPDPNHPELGDIAISYETCAAEAATEGRPLAHHILHLIVHGTLHLLGYDHTNDKDAALMERLEIEILATMGVPDPY